MSASVKERRVPIDCTLADSGSGGTGMDLRDYADRIQMIIHRNQNEKFLQQLLTKAIALEHILNK